MPSTAPTISSLTPEQYGINLDVTVMHSIVSLQLNDGEKTIRVSEYLVGDTTGAIVLKTTQDLQAGSRIQVHNGYTQVVDGYLRLIADTTEPSSEAPFQVNTLNNLSLNKLVRRN